jgi:hypothetical protein
MATSFTWQRKAKSEPVQIMVLEINTTRPGDASLFLLERQNSFLAE